MNERNEGDRAERSSYKTCSTYLLFRLLFDYHSIMKRLFSLGTQSRIQRCWAFITHVKRKSCLRPGDLNKNTYVIISDMPPPPPEILVLLNLSESCASRRVHFNQSLFEITILELCASFPAGDREKFYPYLTMILTWCGGESFGSVNVSCLTKANSSFFKDNKAALSSPEVAAIPCSSCST